MPMVNTVRLRRGFTIVELLIVIVVIAVLAAIVIIAYNGMQQRAQAAALKADFQSIIHKALMYQSATDTMPTYAQYQADTSVSVKVTSSIYKTLTYCGTSSQVALGAELRSGDKYYQQVGQNATQDNTIDVTGVCTKLGITNPDGSAAAVSYVVPAWTYCANENQTCSFSGVRTVRYGANGTYFTKTNVSPSISCSNAVFGDPTPGVVKTCEYQ